MRRLCSFDAALDTVLNSTVMKDKLAGYVGSLTTQFSVSKFPALTTKSKKRTQSENNSGGRNVRARQVHGFDEQAVEYQKQITARELGKLHNLGYRVVKSYLKVRSFIDALIMLSWLTPWSSYHRTCWK